MKREILRKICRVATDKIPRILVTRLSDGGQILLTDRTMSHAYKKLPAAVADQIPIALRQDRSHTLSDKDERYFIQIFHPPKKMIIVGAVHISQALAPMAQMAAFEVIIIDPRTAWATDTRFPGQRINTDWPEDAIAATGLDSRSAVVLLTHDPKLDDPVLEFALHSDAFYIGALGSRKTHAKRVMRLRKKNFTDDQIDRIDAPIGLNIGALSPAEIAISIMASVTLALNGPKG